MKMRKLNVLIMFFLTIGCASAQSLKPEAPYPLKEGINEGISDSFVGIQYWYFYAMPGNSKVAVRFKNPNTVYGAPINTTLWITLSDEKKTWSYTQTVNSNKNTSEAIFKADKLKTRMKIIVRVSPPSGTLIRMGGGYEIEATGDIEFDKVKNDVDPIIGTYEPKVAHYTEYYGTAKFLADGTVETANGFRGTWKLFDRENRIYTVVIQDIRYSVQYHPGYGLTKPGDTYSVVFREVR